MNSSLIGLVIFPEEKLLPVHYLDLFDSAEGLLDPLVDLRLIFAV